MNRLALDNIVFLILFLPTYSFSGGIMEVDAKDINDLLWRLGSCYQVQLSFVEGRPNAFTMDLAPPRNVTRRQVNIAAETPMGPTTYNKAYAPPAMASQASGVRERNFYRYDINHPGTVNARSTGYDPRKQAPFNLCGSRNPRSR